ncbi:MAG: hypothetical protein KDB71_16295 [Mycobacterium sp.]|nr:hypothetical protein [Mycobacterium sp.]
MALDHVYGDAHTMTTFVARILGEAASAYQDRHVATILSGAHDAHALTIAPIEMTGDRVAL